MFFNFALISKKRVPNPSKETMLKIVIWHIFLHLGQSEKLYKINLPFLKFVDKWQDNCKINFSRKPEKMRAQPKNKLFLWNAYLHCNGEEIAIAMNQGHETCQGLKVHSYDKLVRPSRTPLWLRGCQEFGRNETGTSSSEKKKNKKIVKTLCHSNLNIIIKMLIILFIHAM